MADGFEFDFSDINRLAAQIGNVPEHAGPLIRKATEVSARKVSDTWKESLRGSRRIPAGPRTISYDLTGYQGFGVTILEAEIGPEAGSGGVGGLVGALEYGVAGRQAPTGFGHRALEVNEDDFHVGLEKALEDAERKAGL